MVEDCDPQHVPAARLANRVNLCQTRVQNVGKIMLHQLVADA